MSPQDLKKPVKDPIKINVPELEEVDDVEILARTIYGEARGESIAGKEAVASVVLNRVLRAQKSGGRYWWGATVRLVCLKPWQFSCWNRNDVNRQKILSVAKDNRNFQTCMRIARKALAGQLKDCTQGATHYHTASAAPIWSRGRMYSVEIGHHHFYNNVESMKC